MKQLKPIQLVFLGIIAITAVFVLISLLCMIFVPEVIW
jgi:hypothetical protein